MFKIDISRAIEALKKGSVVVYPTDTLYALGADIFNEMAVRTIFKIKKRPTNIPLPIAVSSFDEIEQIAVINDKGECLAKRFLPGTLTLILNKKNNVPNIVTAGLDKVAVRIPNNEDALELLSKFGPLTVTSANIHGMDTPFFIEEIKKQLKEDVEVYLDYGKLGGSPSTIVDMTTDKPKIVREGVISKREILDAI
jgi:L-threonylcarbamoyladenylate synthase